MSNTRLWSAGRCHRSANPVSKLPLGQQPITFAPCEHPTKHLLDKEGHQTNMQCCLQCYPRCPGLNCCARLEASSRQELLHAHGGHQLCSIATPRSSGMSASGARAAPYTSLLHCCRGFATSDHESTWAYSGPGLAAGRPLSTGTTANSRKRISSPTAAGEAVDRPRRLCPSAQNDKKSKV